MNASAQTFAKGAEENPFPIRRLGGLPIAVASSDQVVANFLLQAERRRGRSIRPYYSTSANGQVLAMCDQDEALKLEFLKSDEILADGMPLVLASKIFGKLPLPERVATTDLVHDVAVKAQETGTSFYLLGGSAAVNQAACERLNRLYPKLNIVGARDGYFRDEEEDLVIEQIQNVKPDILWIGMGAPREQFFVSRNLPRLTQVGVIKTSGGLFDFLSQARSRAPNWMQAMGLEWSYRAFLEPKRLGIRYLLTNPQAVRLLITQTDFS